MAPQLPTTIAETQQESLHQWVKNQFNAVHDRQTQKKSWQAWDLKQHCVFSPTQGGHRHRKDNWCLAAAFAYDVFEGFHAGLEMCAVTIDQVQQDL